MNDSVRAAISGSTSLRSPEPVPVSALPGNDPGRKADLELALNYALRLLVRFEPPDSRAMSDEFVSMASIQADLTNEECREILRAAIERDEKEIEAVYGN